MKCAVKKIKTIQFSFGGLSFLFSSKCVVDDVIILHRTKFVKCFFKNFLTLSLHTTKVLKFCANYPSFAPVLYIFLLIHFKTAFIRLITNKILNPITVEKNIPFILAPIVFYSYIKLLLLYLKYAILILDLHL